jgi:hypothetical protein
MTSHFLMVTPVDPLLTPSRRRQDALVDVLRRLRPQTPDWKIESGPAPIFHFGPSSFENVFCPRCGADILEHWQIAMDVWCARADRRDLSTTTPCCGLETTLNELDYDMPQGFACFAVGMERGGPDLEPHELAEAEEAFGAPLRTFWNSF